MTIGVFLNNLSFFMFFGALFFTRPENVLVFYAAFALIALAFLYGVILNRGTVKLHPPIIFFSIFSLFCSLSYLWAVAPEYVLDNVDRLGVIILSLIFISQLSSGSSLRWAKLGMISAVLINFIIFVSPLSHLFRSEDIDARFSGTTANANSLALLSVFAIYFTLKDRELRNESRRVTDWIFCLIPLILILSSESRKGLAFGLIVIMSFALGGRSSVFSKKAIVLFVVSVCALMLLIGSIEVLAEMHPVFERFSGLIDFANGKEADSSTRWRMLFIEDALAMWSDSPIIGMGMNNFQLIHGEGLYSHNNYTEILSGNGLIGLTLYLFFYLSIISSVARRGWRIADVSFIVSILIMDYGLVSYSQRNIICNVFLFYLLMRHSHKNQSNAFLTLHKA